MRLVLFDLDHTLVPFDSGTAWFRYLLARGVLAEEDFAPRQLAFAQDYLAGRLDVVAFQRFCLGILARYPMSDLEAWRDEFLDAIRPSVPEAGLRLVASHRKQGDLCAIVTATNAFVARTFARVFGVEHLVATHGAMAGSGATARFTGELEGEPSYGAGKVTRVQAWLAGLGLQWEDFGRTVFYSDSANDLPLLDLVSDPIAVVPDARLRAIALARGWPVADELEAVNGPA